MTTSADAPSLKQAAWNASDRGTPQNLSARPGTLLLRTRSSLHFGSGDPVGAKIAHSADVVEVGAGVAGFRAGERVASRFPAADQAVVPATLCAKIPENVSDEGRPLRRRRGHGDGSPATGSTDARRVFCGVGP